MRETTRHRIAFNEYLALGPRRSIRKLQELLSKQGKAPTERTLFEWSRALNWQMRIDEFEATARIAEDEVRIKAVREMQERQAREALLLQQQGMEWLGSIDPGEPSPDSAIRAITEGAKLERLARGEVTERTEQRTTSKRMQELSNEELDAFIEFAEKTMGGEIEKES